MLNSLMSSVVGTSLTLTSFLVCTAVSLALGLLTAALFMFRSHYSKSFVVTLAVLPVMVQIIIMMVNGSIGTGIAVAGAFSLIRFRSQPGSAEEIAGVLLSMVLGLTIGLGYVLVACLFFAIVAVFLLVLTATKFGAGSPSERLLRVTIPENLDYDTLFDDLFAKYTTGAELQRIRTTNMGSLYELSYQIKLKDPIPSKAFLDEIRTRNGNLTVLCDRSTQSSAL